MKSHIPPKERILEAASRLFYTQGYHVTGINQILEEADVAKASLYQHFGSKEDLGIAYLKKMRENWYAAFEGHLDKLETPLQKILGTFDLLEKNMRLHGFKGCRFLNILQDVDSSSQRMYQEIVAHKTSLRNLYKKLVRQYATEVHTPVIPNVHDTIYLLFEGAIVESKLYQDAWPIISARKTVAQLLQLTA